MLYRFIKIILSIGIRFYYREIKILRAERLDSISGEPLIVIANHPNTMMDAMLIGYACKQPIYFMAKGTLFNSPFKLWLLKKFNMIPINRQGEGKIEGVSNQDSFEACYKILEEGKTLVIFPEGTSYLERYLRELKTGAARIALEAELRNEGKLNLQIVPLGLNYLQAEKFRSSVLIHVGNRIRVNDYLDSYKNEGSIIAKKLTKKFRTSLQLILVNSDTKDQETIVDRLSEILSSKYLREKESGVEGEILFLKKIRDRIDEIQITQPWRMEELKALIEDINSALLQLGIRADFLDRRFRLQMFFRQLLFSILLVIIGVPVFLVGLVSNIIPFKLTDLIVPKLTKDIEYVAPLAVLLGLIMYPINYFLIYYFTVDYFHFEWFEKIGYYFSMPLTGLLAYSYSRYVVHIRNKWRYIFQMIYNRKSLVEIQNKRSILRMTIFDK